MASINIEPPPDGIDPELSSYLERIVISINIALSQSNQLPKISELPKNPSVGKIYYFTREIPGVIISEGFWGFTSLGWVQLHV